MKIYSYENVFMSFLRKKSFNFIDDSFTLLWG